MSDMKQNYRLSDLMKLRERLVKSVSDAIADKWVKERYDRSVSYGAPRVKDEKGGMRNTPYGVLTNLDAYPERYLRDIPATVVPNDKWGSTAGGEFNPLFGIKIPESSPMAGTKPENALVHEQQHYVDFFLTPKNKMNIYKGDENRLRELLEYKNKIDSYANTRRNDIGEILPELLDYESRLPAGQFITSTEFWNKLNNVQKAMIIRRFQPMPEGVDAMTGVVR